MALEVTKQERETPQSLIRRFSRRVQQSGILFRARKNRFRQKKKSAQMKKKAALRREKTKRGLEKLKKLGRAKKTTGYAR